MVSKGQPHRLQRQELENPNSKRIDTVDTELLLEVSKSVAHYINANGPILLQYEDCQASQELVRTAIKM